MKAEAIGANIRSVRLKKRIKMAALARKAGVSRGHLCGIEHGRWRPSVQLLCRLAEILEVPPDVLIRSPKTPAETSLIKETVKETVKQPNPEAGGTEPWRSAGNSYKSCKK